MVVTSVSAPQANTDNMFCASYLEQRGRLQRGQQGPVHGELPGDLVPNWGESCAAAGKYGVDTHLGKFLSWIHSTMIEVDANGTEMLTGRRLQQHRDANRTETLMGQRC